MPPCPTDTHWQQRLRRWWFGEQKPQGLVRLAAPGLIGAGWLYGGLMRLRRWAYNRGWLPSASCPAPVLSIGNITLGGTGKTPVVDWVCRYFQQQGLRCAIVSRGYGRSSCGLMVVCRGQGPLCSVQQAGDEPYLLARRNPQALVVVAARRSQGVQWAVKQLGAQVVLLDDGFQHLAQQRSRDLVLLDCHCPRGNGRVFPGGALREPPGALRQAHALLYTRCQHGIPPGESGAQPLFSSRHRLGQQLWALDGRGSCHLQDVAELRVGAFAGIAAPESFFAALRQAGLQLAATVSLGDHAVYKGQPPQWLPAAGVDLWLTTEKDAVKLPASGWPQPCYAVPLELDIDQTAGFGRWLLEVLYA